MSASEAVGLKDPPLLIQEIRQQDNYTFQIVWSNGTKHSFRLSDLQKKCPCAKCFDPATGRQLRCEGEFDINVRAERIQNAGRYALRVRFTSGCSNGIYSFAFLNKLAKG